MTGVSSPTRTAEEEIAVKRQYFTETNQQISQLIHDLSIQKDEFKMEKKKRGIEKFMRQQKRKNKLIESLI